MLKHSILTKVEEQALAFKIRRAQRLRSELETILLGKQEQGPPQKKKKQKQNRQRENESVHLLEKQHDVNLSSDEMLLCPQDGVIEAGEAARFGYLPRESYDELDTYRIWSSKSVIM